MRILGEQKNCGNFPQIFTTPMSTIHALLVGINTYPHVPKLNCCVEDAGKMETYLQLHKPEQYTLSSRKLLNEEATKEGIVDAIMSQLSEAAPGDLLVLYFSGHGCQEVPDPEWERLDNGRKLESLVCYDFDFAGNGVLADKELRFLLPMLSQENAVDIVTIIDCCHSGDLTRGDLQPKKLDRLSPLRRWEQFIFNEDLPYATVQSATSLDDILPLADHIHLAACLDQELAYESAGGGVFTTVLLEVLRQAENRISYLNLQSRIHSFVRNKFTQTPQIQAQSKNEEILNTPFLKGTTGGGRSRYNLTFSRELGGWKLDIGQIHGLPADGTLSIPVFSNTNQLLTTATISQVLLSTATVEPTDAAVLDPSVAYYTEITGLSQTTTSVYLQGNILGVSVLKNYLEQEAGELLKYSIALTDDIALAEYSVVAFSKKTAGLTVKGYCIWPPLLLKEEALSQLDEGRAFSDPVKEFTEESAADVLGYLKKMAHWNYVRGIQNTAANGLNDLLDLQIEKATGELVDIDELTKLNLVVGEKIKFKITNTSPAQKLYVYCFLMTQEFGVESLIDDNAYELGSEKAVNAPRTKFITVSPNSTPLPYETVWIKLLYANERISLLTFKQEGLKATRGAKGLDRGDTPEPKLVEPNWGTQTFELRLAINSKDSSPG